MSIDQREAKRQRAADKPKLSTKHPIAAIEKRVIDSEAFAALPPSAIVVLLLLARNLEKGRNGHVFLSQEDAERHGISRKTFYRQLKVLTASGFIFPTKRSGDGQCGRYALTWLPLGKDMKGLHVENFQACAWREYSPRERKKRGVKMSTVSGQNYPSALNRVDKIGHAAGDKITTVEFNTNTHFKSSARTWIAAELARLAQCGLAGRQCFQIPAERAPTCH